MCWESDRRRTSAFRGLHHYPWIYRWKTRHRWFCGVLRNKFCANWICEIARDGTCRKRGYGECAVSWYRMDTDVVSSCRATRHSRPKRRGFFPIKSARFYPPRSTPNDKRHGSTRRLYRFAAEFDRTRPVSRRWQHAILGPTFHKKSSRGELGGGWGRM